MILIIIKINVFISISVGAITTKPQQEKKESFVAQKNVPE